MPGTWPTSDISRSSGPSIWPSIDPSLMPSFTSSRPLPPTRSTRSSPSATFSPAISSKQQPEIPLSGLHDSLSSGVGVAGGPVRREGGRRDVSYGTGPSGSYADAVPSPCTASGSSGSAAELYTRPAFSAATPQLFSHQRRTEPNGILREITRSSQSRKAAPRG